MIRAKPAVSPPAPGLNRRMFIRPSWNFFRCGRVLHSIGNPDVRQRRFAMKLDPQSFFKMFGTLALATVSLVPAASAQTAEEKTSGKGDQWIHVRVVSREDKGETVRVNVPIEMAEKVIPAITKDNLKNGRLHIDNAHMDEVDFRALLDAVRTAKDGQYVTVQSHENNVKVEKKAGYLYIYVIDKEGAKKA